MQRQNGRVDAADSCWGRGRDLHIEHGRRCSRQDHRYDQSALRSHAITARTLWCAVLAGAALATRFVPFRAHGEWNFWPTLLVALIALAALTASLYIVILLEIVKLRRLRAWAIWRRDSEERRHLKRSA